MNTRILINDGTKPFWNVPEMFSDIPWEGTCGSKTTGILLGSLVLAFNVRTALEIGIANGFTTVCLLKAIETNAGREGRLVSCDYNENSCIIGRRLNHGTVAHTVLPGDSSKADWTLTFGDKKCDLIYIDGDHSYEGCKEDILRTSKVLKDGGLFVIHDYAPGQPGVMKAVDELCSPPDYGRLILPEHGFSESIASIVCQKYPKWMRV